MGSCSTADAGGVVLQVQCCKGVRDLTERLEAEGAGEAAAAVVPNSSLALDTVSVPACVHACMRACVHVRMRACVHACMCACALWDT